MAKTLGIMLLCFGRLKGSQRELEARPESSEEWGSLSQKGPHLEARARGAATALQTLSPVSAFLGRVMGGPLALVFGPSGGASFPALPPL